MKTISVRDLQERIRSVMETAQNDQVAIARNGAAARGSDRRGRRGRETLAVETSRSFWKEIALRRDQETVSLAEIRKRLHF